jgi:hypothetical protein
LARPGGLSDAAMDRAVSALSICADKLVRRHVTPVRSVATEACRQASNGADFVARVYAETGIALEVINPETEAKLAVLGCHALLEPGRRPGAGVRHWRRIDRADPDRARPRRSAHPRLVLGAVGRGVAERRASRMSAATRTR